VKEEARWPIRPQKGPQPNTVWSDKSGRRFHAFVVGPGVLLAAGHTEQNFLAAIDTAKGADLWLQDLPAAAVPGGIAVDHDGNVIVALDDGQVRAFGER
jgi:hypothetical protein